MPTHSIKTRGRSRGRVAATILGVALLGNLRFGGTPAGATAPTIGATAPAGGAIQVFVTPDDNGGGPIVITGAIGDAGTTRSIDKNGKTDPNGNFVMITLKKGTFEVDSTAVNAASNNVQPTINAKTCSGYFSMSGSVTLLKGTGLYTGIRGTVKTTGTFAFIGPVYAGGKKKGQCNMSNSAQPIAQYASIIGSGTVRFS